MAVHQESLKGEGELTFRSETDWKLEGKRQRTEETK